MPTICSARAEAFFADKNMGSALSVLLMTPQTYHKVALDNDTTSSAARDPHLARGLVEQGLQHAAQRAADRP